MVVRDPIYRRVAVGDMLSQNEIRALIRRHAEVSDGEASILPAGDDLDRLVAACNVGFGDPSEGSRPLDEPWCHVSRVSRDTQIALSEAGIGQDWSGRHSLTIEWMRNASGDGPWYLVRLEWHPMSSDFRPKESWWTEADGGTVAEAIARCLTMGWTLERIGLLEAADA